MPYIITILSELIDQQRTIGTCQDKTFTKNKRRGQPKDGNE